MAQFSSRSESFRFPPRQQKVYVSQMLIEGNQVQNTCESATYPRKTYRTVGGFVSFKI